MPVVGVPLRQFKLMQDRLAAKRTGAGPNRQKPIDVPAVCRPAKMTQVILGIDPSLRSTGYGVIRTGPQMRDNPCALDYGTISPGNKVQERSSCLLHLVRAIRALLDRYHPDVCVVEGLFYGPNPKTAQAIGEARGAVLATAAEAGVEIFELAPRKVKQAIVGYGTAQKFAVAKMVQRMLNLPAVPEPDAADALALALAYTHEQSQPGLKTLKPL